MLFLSCRVELEQHLRNFSSILREICTLADDKVKYNYNSLSGWWQEIRELLLESPSALKALLAAMVCRNVSAEYRQREVRNYTHMIFEIFVIAMCDIRIHRENILKQKYCFYVGNPYIRIYSNFLATFSSLRENLSEVFA